MFGVPVSKKRHIMVGDLDAAVSSSGYDTYDREKLYIIISMKMGDHSGFEEYNDFIVNHVELIQWTFQNMDKLCS